LAPRAAVYGDAESDGPIVGYGGLWMQFDEAHISTLAVDPDCRRRHIGERLLLALIDCALSNGAMLLTLEVRVSNSAAQALYQKYGFEAVGYRKSYYTDTQEDAVIMSTPDLDDAAWQAQFERLRSQLTGAP
jgi:ribosomal-protein-alanine N-acetyltransferase